MNGIRVAPIAGLAAAFWALLGSLSCEARQTHRSNGAPSCPIQINIKYDASPVVVAGHLSPRRPSFSYRFSAGPNISLGWTYKGPAVRVLLTDPDGETDGPGLPNRLLLEKKGSYVFSVASNLMADKIYGKFRLSFSLSAKR
jgi:hypothetical protein